MQKDINILSLPLQGGMIDMLLTGYTTLTSKATAGQSQKRDRSISSSSVSTAATARTAAAVRGQRAPRAERSRPSQTRRLPWCKKEEERRRLNSARGVETTIIISWLVQLYKMQQFDKFLSWCNSRYTIHSIIFDHIQLRNKGFAC